MRQYMRPPTGRQSPGWLRSQAMSGGISSELRALEAVGRTLAQPELVQLTPERLLLGHQSLPFGARLLGMFFQPRQLLLQLMGAEIQRRHAPTVRSAPPSWTPSRTWASVVCHSRV